MPVYQDMTFNPATYPGGAAAIRAFALNYWSIMAGGQIIDTLAGHIAPTVLAHPRFISDGADSHLLFSFAKRPDIIEAAGAYSTQALLFADLSPTAGYRVNCWDPDDTKCGVYDKVGGAGLGSWTRVQPVARDRGWDDYNHPQRLLQLLICSFIYTTSLTPPSFMGNQQGWIGPADGDWRDMKLTLTLGCKDFAIGPYTKVGPHVQGNEPIRAAALTAKYAEGDKYFLPNFINTKTLISDALGFAASSSWGRPNDVPIVHASGKKVIEITYSTDDDDWHCFGDPGRDPAGRTVNYGAAPIASILQNLQGNSYMLAHKFTPKQGTKHWQKSSDETLSDFDGVSGDLMLYGVKVER